MLSIKNDRIPAVDKAAKEGKGVTEVEVEEQELLGANKDAAAGYFFAIVSSFEVITFVELVPIFEQI